MAQHNRPPEFEALCEKFPHIEWAQVTQHVVVVTARKPDTRYFPWDFQDMMRIVVEGADTKRAEARMQKAFGTNAPLPWIYARTKDGVYALAHTPRLRDAYLPGADARTTHPHMFDVMLRALRLATQGRDEKFVWDDERPFVLIGYEHCPGTTAVRGAAGERVQCVFLERGEEASAFKHAMRHFKDGFPLVFDLRNGTYFPTSEVFRELLPHK